jgi:predicted transcriptional regulator
MHRMAASRIAFRWDAECSWDTLGMIHIFLGVYNKTNVRSFAIEKRSTLARQICQAHGGLLQVANRLDGPGCGAEIRLAKFADLPRAGRFSILKGMEVHFTPEQEAQLAQIATSEGTEPERLVKDAALRMLQEDTRLRAAVREGIAQADRGEFIEEDEMAARLEQMLRS